MIPNAPPTTPLHIVVVIPVRDDWPSTIELIRMLDKTICAHPYTVDVLLVDDGSIQKFDLLNFGAEYAAVRSVKVLRLRRNLGHQRAIAIGLVHVQKSIPCNVVLVMDGDGEDTAEGALQLLREFSGIAVFAARTRRRESAGFKISYALYKLAHRIFTGISVRVGNFSILPAGYLDTLVVMSELWNHYAAAVFRSGLAFTSIPVPKGNRIAGSSRMNFLSLAIHGMSAISVFGDVIGVRLLIASAVGSLAAVLGMLTVIAIRIFTDRAIPGWATYSVGILAVILIQFITAAASFTFSMLSNRADFSFVPIRDCEMFIAESLEIYRND